MMPKALRATLNCVWRVMNCVWRVFDSCFPTVKTGFLPLLTSHAKQIIQIFDNLEKDKPLADDGEVMPGFSQDPIRVVMSVKFGAHCSMPETGLCKIVRI